MAASRDRSRFRQDEFHVYRVAELEQFPWLDHGFGTRRARDWLPAAELVTLRQVHSGTVHRAGELPGCLGEGDALVTDRSGRWLGIRTADCVPILLADTRRRAVAVIHAGWRGALDGVVANTVARMTHEFHSAPEDLHAAIGPAIGACCYEVGPEVASRFQAIFPERKDLDGKTRLDLAEAVGRQLRAAGLVPERIYAGAPCTFCHPRDFHSFRRDREQAGRVVSGIGITGRPQDRPSIRL